MKVILINPPTPENDVRIREGRCIDTAKWEAPFTPISLAYIATQVDKIAESKLIDAGPQDYNLEKVLEEIENFKPELMIFARSTPTALSDFGWFLPQVKKRFPAIKMATTSIHATVLAKEVMEKYKDLDFIICREPEITAYELTQAIKENLDFKEILGLIYRDNNGTVVINPPRPLVENLDELGMPAWQKVDFSKYTMPIKNRAFTLINITRGCPYACKYCIAHVYSGRQLRKRSPELIVKEIKFLNSLGVYEFLFWTEFLTTDKEYLSRLLGLIIKENLHKKISWVTNSRTDHVDLEIFNK
jgi:anaerobic magnesium-protoporphyrin IX monomethyl ester cyclase